jgi:acyl carrier protein
MASEDLGKENGMDAGSEGAAGSTVRERPELLTAYVEPQTTLQEVLLTVWSSVLNTEKIGVDDDFFELGGDSVLATQVVSRVRDMFRVELPPIVLFEAPTIATLASYMIANEVKPGLTEKTAGVLKRIAGMTEEEVSRSLLSR